VGGDGEGGGEEDEGRRGGKEGRGGKGEGKGTYVWFGGLVDLVGGGPLWAGRGREAMLGGLGGGGEEKGGGVLDEHVWECLGGVSKNQWIAVVGWQRSRPLRGHQARSRFIGGTVVRRTISLLLKRLFSLGIEIVGRREQDNGFPLRRAATISTNAESSG